MKAYSVTVWSRIPGDPYSSRIEARPCQGEPEDVADAALAAAVRPKGLRRTREAWAEKVRVELVGEMVILRLAERPMATRVLPASGG